MADASAGQFRSHARRRGDGLSAAAQRGILGFRRDRIRARRTGANAAAGTALRRRRHDGARHQPRGGSADSQPAEAPRARMAGACGLAPTAARRHPGHSEPGAGTELLGAVARRSRRCAAPAPAPARRANTVARLRPQPGRRREPVSPRADRRAARGRVDGAPVHVQPPDARLSAPRVPAGRRRGGLPAFVVPGTRTDTGQRARPRTVREQPGLLRRASALRRLDRRAARGKSGCAPDGRRARLLFGLPVVRAAERRRALLRHPRCRRMRGLSRAASGAVRGAVPADGNRSVARACGAGAWPLPTKCAASPIRRGASCCGPTPTSTPSASP